jgi:hypothetical protein
VKLWSEVEREVDAIRLAIHDETKHMTVDERLEYYRKSTEETARQYGYRLIPSQASPTSPRGVKFVR